MSINNLFGTCDEWKCGHSSVTLINASEKKLLKLLKDSNIPGDMLFNYSKGQDGVIRFDASGIRPFEICDFLCDISKKTIVYASWHWREDLFIAMRNHKRYKRFSGEFLNDTPKKSSKPGYYDIEVEFMDKKYNTLVRAGGEMCTKRDKKYYEKLVGRSLGMKIIDGVGDLFDFRS